MKILKRNYGHRNLILFLGLSLVYLQAIYSLSIGKSLFSIMTFRTFFTEHYFVLALTIITANMVIKIKKYSEIMLLVCLITLVGKNFIMLSNSFNKLTLVLNFIYLLFAFYFYITWELEVAQASFTPKFSKLDLEKESRFKLQAKISSDENGADAVECLVTNIDEGSCFLLLSTDKSRITNSSKKYYLESVYEGVQFRHQARLVSSYDRGIGLVFEDSPSTRLNWSELYKVCLERGQVT